MLNKLNFCHTVLKSSSVPFVSTQLNTLIRETKEETGFHVIPTSAKEYGKTVINLVYVTLAEAIEANKKLLDIPDISWAERDLEICLNYKTQVVLQTICPNLADSIGITLRKSQTHRYITQ